MGATVIVHGGAGDVPLAKRPLHAEGCKRAAERGLAALNATRDVLQAVLVAVRELEEAPRFNAGTGASLTRDGTLEVDASVMLGSDLSFGAVATLPPYAHPIDVAEAVRRDARHALYAGPGADAFARRHGFEPAPPDTMITDASRERLERVLSGDTDVHWAGNTVGAVASDGAGRVAAATSTGGTVGKIPGRIGDTPLPGAGTFADDHGGACSTTGVGEHIMRFGLARHAVDLLRAGVPAQHAADAAVAGFGQRIAGRGGLILVGPRGDFGFARNTATMSYAIAGPDGTRFGF